MSNIIITHQCQSTICWNPIRIPSGTDPDKVYTVHVNPWGHVKENICECYGYQYRGQCKHQNIAQRRVCHWHQLTSDVEQTEEQRIEGICPECGSPTIRQVYDSSELESN